MEIFSEASLAGPDRHLRLLSYELTSSGSLWAPNRRTLLRAGVLPPSLQSLDGIPNTFSTGLMALASEWIPNRMSTSHCVMTTLHLGRDD